jgi:hypothetical protein
MPWDELKPHETMEGHHKLYGAEVAKQGADARGAREPAVAGR